MEDIRLKIPKGYFKEYTGRDKHSSIDGYNLPKDYMSNTKHNRNTWKNTGICKHDEGFYYVEYKKHKSKRCSECGDEISNNE